MSSIETLSAQLGELHEDYHLQRMSLKKAWAELATARAALAEALAALEPFALAHPCDIWPDLRANAARVLAKHGFDKLTTGQKPAEPPKT